MRAKTLAPVRPSPAIEAAYRARLDRLVEDMHRSLRRWLLAAYRREGPEVAALMAADASPARALAATARRLSRYWQRKFDAAAADLARYFAESTAKRSDAALRLALRKGGFSVRFTMTRAMNDAVQGTVAENVALIRSIGQQHLTQVKALVARSVQAGRDLGPLAEALEHQFGVTKRRAALISRDQNNKVTAALQRVRHAELGIKRAVWVHSGGGKHPRPSHVKAGRDREQFSVKDGWWDPAIRKYIWPGSEIQCRCVSRPVVMGFS